MHAAHITAVGGPERITWGPVPDPVLGPHEVLVRPTAVAVDLVDTFVRSGRWATPLAFPAAVGRDLVGVVTAVGADTSGFASGDVVWTNSAGYDGRAGATAERVPVPQDRLYPLPPGADPAGFVAAGHPAATAHAGLARAGLRPGEMLAVVGANGAVGMCLVQRAVALGASVVAVVRNAAAVEALRALGASTVVVAAAEEVSTALGAAAPDGVDVVADTTGRVDTAGVVEVLRRRGRILLLAGRGRAQLDLWRLETRELPLIGFVMSGMTVPELRDAAAWIRADRPRVAVGPVLRFADARRAHETLESGALPRTSEGLVARIVLQP